MDMHDPVLRRLESALAAAYWAEKNLRNVGYLCLLVAAVLSDVWKTAANLEFTPKPVGLAVLLLGILLVACQPLYKKAVAYFGAKVAKRIEY